MMLLFFLNADHTSQIMSPKRSDDDLQPNKNFISVDFTLDGLSSVDKLAAYQAQA
jgi:hypothetical protein